MVNPTLDQLREIIDRPRTKSLTNALINAAHTLRDQAPEEPPIASIEILAIYKAGPRQYHPLSYRLLITHTNQSVTDETVCSNNIPEAYQAHLTEAKIREAKQNHRPVQTRP